MHFGHPRPPFDCRVCRRDEDKRTEWGCDLELDPETAEPVDQFSCWRCKPFYEDPECTVCAGSGRWRVYRCPNVLLEGFELTAHQVCQDAILLDTGILPAAGGWSDQAASWVAAVTFVAGQRAQYEAARRAPTGGTVTAE